MISNPPSQGIQNMPSLGNLDNSDNKAYKTKPNYKKINTNYRVSAKKGSFTHYHSLVKDPFFVDTL